MGGYSPINKGMFMGFMAAPFIFELKIIADWTFTRTALDLFQWIKFESVYGELFVAKCTNKPIMEHPLGKKIPKIMKLILGCGGLAALVLIIAGPLLLFSGLNPLADYNPVLGASLTLNIITNITTDEEGPTNVYQLYHTDNFLRVEPVSNDAYKILSNYRVIRNLDRTQFQQVQLSNVSDSSWTISPPAQRAVFKRIKDARDGINTSLPINIELIYAFDRAEPAGQPRVDKPLSIINILDKGVTGREQIIEALYEALDPQAPCVEDKAIEFTIQNWLIPTVRLPASIKPKLIRPTEKPGLEQNIFIRRRCENNEERGTISFWWEVEQDRWTFDGEIKDAKTEDDKYQGIFFFVWSEKVTGSLTSYSVVTFYIVVVLGIGTVLRDVIKVGPEQIFIKDMPKPDSLMLICEGILISRLENNLEREEQLYFILIDIMRSPEIIKMITSSSLKKKGPADSDDS